MAEHEQKDTRPNVPRVSDTLVDAIERLDAGDIDGAQERVEAALRVVIDLISIAKQPTQGEQAAFVQGFLDGRSARQSNERGE
jgi:hypothetical protein